MTTEVRKIPMNESFRESNNTRARYRVECGSAGSGKSVNVARDFIIKLSDKRYKGANLLCVRKTESSHLDSTYAELQRAIRDVFGDTWERYWEISRSPLRMRSLVTDGVIIFRGTKDDTQREKLKSIQSQSGKIVWVWIEEATELDKGDFDIIDDRLRGDLNEINPNLYYQITLTFNPVSANHWIKKRFFDSGDSGAFTHRSNYLTNAFIDEEYHKRMMRRREQDYEGYRIYGLGEWGESEGLILPKFEVREITRDISHYDSVAMGQDFGFNHANSILLVGFLDGDVYVLREIYTRYRDTHEIIAMADASRLPKNVIMWCDSAEPDRIKTWRDKGYLAEGVKKEKGSIGAQIDYLKSHKIIIHPLCENLIREIGEWKWERDTVSGEYTDIPVSINDDAIASLRYSIEGIRKNKRLKTISKKILKI
jgi:phage terminase large subunit